ncbi:nucleoporin (NUP54/57), putative, partial [Trypanosoma cruzi]
MWVVFMCIICCYFCLRGRYSSVADENKKKNVRPTPNLFGGESRAAPPILRCTPLISFFCNFS